MVTNLIKHSNLKDSTFIAQRAIVKGSVVMELISIDKGPGINSIPESMRDGFSTAGSSGSGLGSISRMSDSFDIYSQKETGTVILSRIFADKVMTEKGRTKFNLGAFCIPKPGEEANGDKWSYIEHSDRFLILTADGLGHGIDAAKASGEAVLGFEDNSNLPIDEIMHLLHLRLRPTRGAAVALTEIIPSKKIVRFCSIGNISGSILTDSSIKNMISYNGIVGHENRKIHVNEYPWPDGAVLLLYSDGIVSRWSLDKYPGLLRKQLPVVAAVFYRDFQRGNDDLSVILARSDES